MPYDTVFGDDLYWICFDHPNRETAMQSPQKQFSNSLLQFWVSSFCFWNNLCLFLGPKCLGKVRVAGGCIPLCYEKSHLILCTNQGSLRIRICRGNTKQHFCKYRSGREQRESREWKCALPPSERAPEGESINNSSPSLFKNRKKIENAESWFRHRGPKLWKLWWFRLKITHGYDQLGPEACTCIFSIFGICGIFGYYILDGWSLSILKGDPSESWIEIWRAQNFWHFSQKRSRIINKSIDGIFWR